MASAAILHEVVQNYEDKVLIVSWTDGEKQAYPYVWLRANCQCRTVCWHESGLSIRGDTKFNFDVEVTPKTLNVTGANSSNLIKVEWSDGHKSEYLSSWLRQYKFENSARDTRFDPKLRYWGADVDEKQLKKLEFCHLMSSDEVLMDFMVELKELGIVMVVGAPTKEGTLHQIGKRVSFLQPTNFGPVCEVQTRYIADGGPHYQVSYQNGFLPLHTDLSYYQKPSGIMLVHCLQQVPGEGGESLVADGFHAAETLKRESPGAFELLTSSIFENFNTGDAFYGKYHHQARHSVIQLDSRGEIQRIVFSDHSRDAMLRIPVHKVLPAYRALKTFREKLYDPANLFKYKLREGDILCVNNYRVLHGRTNFEITETTNRLLEVGFLEWDQVNSRIRILQESGTDK